MTSHVTVTHMSHICHKSQKNIEDSKTIMLYQISFRVG